AVGTRRRSLASSLLLLLLLGAVALRACLRALGLGLGPTLLLSLLEPLLAGLLCGGVGDGVEPFELRRELRLLVLFVLFVPGRVERLQARRRGGTVPPLVQLIQLIQLVWMFFDSFLRGHSVLARLVLLRPVTPGR